MTLTTPKKPKRELSEAFGVLKHRLKRVEIKKLVEDGYLDKDDVKRFYAGRWHKVGLDCDYLKVETDEGANGCITSCILEIIFHRHGYRISGPI